jgi:hypothetical protein
MMKPKEKSFQFFPGAFGPNFDIAIMGVSNPARETQEPGFMQAGIAEAHALNTAFDAGKEGGNVRYGRA